MTRCNQVQIPQLNRGILLKRYMNLILPHLNRHLNLSDQPHVINYLFSPNYLWKEATIHAMHPRPFIPLFPLTSPATLPTSNSTPGAVVREWIS